MKVHPGYYWISFTDAKGGWGDVSCIVTIPQEPEDFMRMTRAKIAKDGGPDNPIIIAISKVAGSPKRREKRRD